MNQKLALYILVNKDIDITAGKLAGQVSHAIIRYITSNKGIADINLHEFLKMKDNERIIVTLKCPISRLEQLEKEGYPVQRDLGLTELEPNTLTCTCYGVVDREKDEIPSWLKRLRLYN